MKPVLAAALAALSAGCFLQPGMRMDVSGLEKRGEGSAEAARFHIRQIDPPLLVTQAKARAEAEKAQLRPAKEASAEDYRISAYDVLSVIVWDHPELTIPAGEFRSAETSGYPVTATGTIFFPHVGLVEVAGHTVAEVRELLTARLSRYVKDPQLQVLIAAYRGKRAQVAGEVLQPSSIPITDVPMRLQDAIAAAKGFTPEADPAHVTLTRNGEVHHLDLLALYEKGDVTQNWLLKDGDVVHVPDRSANKVFVLGEVKKPSSKLMTRGRMTLAEALGDAEFLDLLTANPASIFVFRGRYDAPDVFLLDASSPDALLLATQFQMQPRDVVFVSTANLARFNRVLNQILPTVQGVWEAYTVARPP